MTIDDGGLPPEVLISRDDGVVVVVTLNRPDRFNTLNADMTAAIRAAFDSLRHDRDCRVIVLTGAGRHFCAGADLAGHGVAPGGDGSFSATDWQATQEDVASLVTLLRRQPQPVIAAVNGAASGGGFGMALASDIRVCGAEAKFNAAAIRIGLSACDMGVSWLLPRIVGSGRAFELLLTGDFVHADDALAMGLVTHVHPTESLVASAIDLATRIASNSPHGVRLTKSGMWTQLDLASLSDGIALENAIQMSLVRSEDHAEAIRAFLEKRPPEFRDA